MDYELIGQRQTGLDLVEELSLGPQSILVTSRFEEHGISERCNKLCSAFLLIRLLTR